MKYNNYLNRHREPATTWGAPSFFVFSFKFLIIARFCNFLENLISKEHFSKRSNFALLKGALITFDRLENLLNYEFSCLAVQFSE